jgi:hypothetical protein
MRSWFLVALFAGGCGAVSPSETGAADTSVPVLGFAADWSVTQSGPLVAGGTAVIHYDWARLPECRGRSHGGDAWAIQASWQGDGGAVQNGVVHRYVGMNLVPADLTIQVPSAGDLAVWFKNTDVNGCVAWDSDYGRNFHFNIETP